MSHKLSRREFLKSAALLGLGASLSGWMAGCQPAAKEEAGAPAAKEEAKQPVEAEKIELRYMERAGSLGDFMRHASRVFEEQNPNVTIVNESSGWGDLVTKVQTNVAAGTMADLAFQHGAWMLPELAKKGAWLDVEPLADADNHDFSIYYKWAIDTLRLGPKDELAAMPMGVHLGENEFMWNVELLKELGVPEPNDQMGESEMTQLFVDIQKQLPEGSFATYLPTSLWGMEAHSRSFGGAIVSQDRKSCGFDQEATQAAHRWIYDLINTHKVMPGRGQVLNDHKSMFYTGTLATDFNCSANLWVGFQQATEGKLALGHCVWPHGGGLGWGTTPSCDATVVYKDTKYPETCWQFVKLQSSFEISKWTALHESHMTPGAVISAWHDPEVMETNPCYANCAVAWDTLKDEEIGSMPVPYNTRRAEFADMYDNEWQAMLYGDKPYDQPNIDALQKQLQEIMDKPVP
jgi:ABC-type glycerol-3-phosphate transport system substrate-binding protein